MPSRLRLERYTGIFKIVEFTEELGLTSLYVNPVMQECRPSSLHSAVEVCVEVVEALWINGFPKTGLQDAGASWPGSTRFIFSDLPKTIMSRPPKKAGDGIMFRDRKSVV